MKIILPSFLFIFLSLSAAVFGSQSSGYSSSSSSKAAAAPAADPDLAKVIQLMQEAKERRATLREESKRIAEKSKRIAIAKSKELYDKAAALNNTEISQKIFEIKDLTRQILELFKKFDSNSNSNEISKRIDNLKKTYQEFIDLVSQFETLLQQAFETVQYSQELGEKISGQRKYIQDFRTQADATIKEILVEADAKKFKAALNEAAFGLSSQLSDQKK